MNGRTRETIRGAAWGAFIGAMIGLGICTWVIDEPPFFDGDTILMGALGLGVLGHLYGDPVVDRVVDTWWRWS